MGGGNGDTADDDDDDCGGDRGEGILLFSVKCTGNIRVTGTGVGRDMDSVVTGVIVVVLFFVVDIDELAHGD